jgi:sulfur-oxidizing protein SoxA
MPKWEPRLNKVLGVEEFVTRHAKATTGASWLMETDDNLAMSVYLRFLANGSPIKLDTTSAEAKTAIERGKELSQRKVGQLNMACTDCHGKVANHWIRGQWLGEPKGQYDHFPTWRTSLLKVWDIRQRFQWCQVNMRRRAAAGRQGIWRPGALSGFAERGSEVERAGHPALSRFDRA